MSSGRHFKEAEKSAPSAPDGNVRPGGARRRLRIVSRALIAALAVVAVVGAGSAFAVSMMIKNGKLSMLDAQHQQAASTEARVSFKGREYERNEDIVAIAVLGFDRNGKGVEGGKAGQSDANMVVAVDTKTGTISALSIPRDSMVPVDRYVDSAYLGQETQQLCLAFSYGDGYQTSCERTVDAISRMLGGQPISYYFAVDMNGIYRINDSVGGVTLVPLETIPRSHIVQGRELTLLGQDAFDYLHYRDTSKMDSPLDRQRREEQYLQAFARKMLATAQKGDVTQFANLYRTASEFSVTDLGLQEFMYLASVVVNNGVTSIDTRSIQGTYRQDGAYAEFYPDKDSVKQAVLDTFFTEVKE